MKKFNWRDILLAILTTICTYFGAKEVSTYALAPDMPVPELTGPVRPDSLPDELRGEPNRFWFVIADIAREHTIGGGSLPAYNWRDTVERSFFIFAPVPRDYHIPLKPGETGKIRSTLVWPGTIPKN